MTVEYIGAKVTIKMTIRQLESLGAVFESFTDQVDERNEAYGDCVRNIKKLWAAIAAAKSEGEL